jgi:hypothetical protein
VRLDADDIDLHLEQVGERQSQPDLVEERRFVGELHERIDVGPGGVLAPSDRAEHSRLERLVCGDQARRMRPRTSADGARRPFSYADKSSGYPRVIAGDLGAMTVVEAVQSSC